MIELIENVGRLDKFDFTLMVRSLDRLYILPSEKLAFIFQSGIRITV